MAAVERLGIDPVEPPHAGGKIGFGSFDHQVVMVVHQTIGIAAPALLVDLAAEQGEEPGTVRVVEEDVLAGIAPGRQVVDGARKFQS